jgi:hypothetical protein
MDENPYRAPARTIEQPKLPRQRLTLRVRLMLAFRLAVAALLGFEGAVSVFDAVGRPSLKAALKDMEAAAILLALSAYMVWYARRCLRGDAARD